MFENPILREKLSNLIDTCMKICKDIHGSVGSMFGSSNLEKILSCEKSLSWFLRQVKTQGYVWTCMGTVTIHNQCEGDIYIHISW